MLYNRLSVCSGRDKLLVEGSNKSSETVIINSLGHNIKPLNVVMNK